MSNEVPRGLRFQRSQFRLDPRGGRTINASSFESEGGHSWIDNQADARGEDSDYLVPLVKQMPQSLTMRAGGELVPDWVKILSRAARRQTGAVEVRAFVLERRFRNGETREEIVAAVLATAAPRDRRKAAARVRDIVAAWRWLDRAAVQADIRRAIAEAKHQEQVAAAREILGTSTATDPCSRLRQLAQDRLQTRLREQAPEFAGPSLMIETPKDCHKYGAVWHRVPGVSPAMAKPSRTAPLPRDTGTGRPKYFKPERSKRVPIWKPRRESKAERAKRGRRAIWL